MNRNSKEQDKVTAPQVVCRHSEKNWQVEPHSGDVWCFKCNPPRNLTDDHRRVLETLDEQPEGQP